ncbi:Crp/Fnr family transcriptional regulator [Pseudoalteromonas luteoviolacea]|uniref:Crp/Fnr family transcriptional regulator n=1 Tax=Pseudoalteromonas luteoviolacea TaxID=43657 RepID=UPI001F404331|nr:Crp/Fnr family transcriptional regulator [Pseudoalteromonas luteoviolacea]MCF6438757.1 Crp/Fnr family transcriptional regulator [Pseudoalteromonas luteoviolacea]
MSNKDSFENKARLLHFLRGGAPFEEREVTACIDVFEFKTYQPKSHIFVSQDIVKDVHFLLSGFGRYYYIDIDGKEFNKSLVKPGGAFTSIGSLIAHSPSPFSAQALSECEIASISYQDLIRFAEQNSQWSTFVRRLYERLALKKERREASLLLLDAQQRYEQFLDEFGKDSELIALNQIAMYLGITDVSLSRIRKKMGLT